MDDIISNSLGSGYQVVTIEGTDAGFESNGCGEWTDDLSKVTNRRRAPIEEGTYIVGVDILPGTWRSGSGDTCYGARLSGFGGTLDEIIANNLGSGLVMTVAPSDRGFTVSGCQWTYVGP